MENKKTARDEDMDMFHRIFTESDEETQRLVYVRNSLACLIDRTVHSREISLDSMREELDHIKRSLGRPSGHADVAHIYTDAYLVIARIKILIKAQPRDTLDQFKAQLTEINGERPCFHSSRRALSLDTVRSLEH